MDNGCEINTTDNFHATFEEVQVSDLSRAIMTSDQSSDNGSTQLSEQNKVCTVVDTNASNDIIATVTSMPISTEIPPSRAPEPSTMAQKHAQDEDIPLKLCLRDRKKVYYCDGDFETGYDLPVERKRSRLSHTEQNLLEESDSVATSIVDGQKQQQSMDESETDDEESKYEFEQSADDISEMSTETRDIRAQEKRNHCESNEIEGQGNSRPKARPQLKKKRQISQLDIGAKHAVGGEKRHKCGFCHYATNNTGHLTDHIRTHTGEKPFKCIFCSYASATRTTLMIHTRTHTGEKPFKCSECSYACAQNSNLKHHLRIYHSLC
ncbi:zinc-finger double domain-containing protein [Ditylenchus destructor]|nr:zinc-finger double domain-containing protein [Ditylenchus destructor]